VLRRTVPVLFLALLGCDSGERPRGTASVESPRTASAEAPKPSSTATADARAQKLEGAARALLAGQDGDATNTLLAPAPKVEAWFRSTFGTINGNVLLTKWQETSAKDPRAELVRTFKEAAAKGASDVRALVVDSEETPGATTTQRAALRVAREPLVLYTLRFVKADGTKVSDLWSFAAIDGAFAHVGPMTMALQLKGQGP
jgi:hypothetical protein